MDGPDRTTVESSQQHPATGPGSPRQTGSALERPAQSARRCAVDFAHGCTVERPPRTIRSVPDRASALPELGTLRSHGNSSLGHGPGSQRPGWPGPARVLHRRNVCSGEKRGRLVGKTKRGKGTKVMAVADGHGLPVAICTESASPAEVKLVSQTVEQRFVADVPERLVGDKAYDSDRLDAQILEQFGTEVIAPHKCNRRSPRTQDGRALRRFCRRWKVERLFAWLYNFRRLVVRYEYHAENYLGFLHLACAMILLRYL